MQLLRFQGEIAHINLVAIEREFIRVFFHLFVFVLLLLPFLNSKWHHGLWWKPVGPVAEGPAQPWVEGQRRGINLFLSFWQIYN